MPVSPSLQRKDPVLEGLKKSNSSFIHMNRYAPGIAAQLCCCQIYESEGHVDRTGKTWPLVLVGPDPGG